MEILVGVQSSERGDEAVAVADALARGLQAGLLLSHVHPQPWRAWNQGRVDAEWRAYLFEQSQAALQRAVDRLSQGVPHREVVHAHASSGLGLAEVADEQRSAMVLVGSAPGGRAGRVVEGSTSDRLLHGSPVPVLVVPAGYRPPPTLPERVTVEYLHTLDSHEALRAGVALARRAGVPLRLVTVVVQPPSLLPHAASLLDDLRRDARGWQDEALALVPSEVPVTAELVEGPDFAHAVAAVDVLPGEVLVCGSSTAGPVQRVLLGDATSKILRSSPVPVMVVPRGSEARELDLTRPVARIEAD